MTPPGDPTGPTGPDPQPEQVGSLGEETARLLDALASWAHGQEPEPGPEAGPEAGPQAGPEATSGGGSSGRLGPLAGRVADAAREAMGDLGRGVPDDGDLDAHLERHLATGSAECTYCPVCRAVSLVRSTSPEVREHLTAAATSLLQAGAGLLAGWSARAAEDAPPEAPAPGRARGSRPERIDLDDLDDLEEPGEPGEHEEPGEPKEART